jgi:hypothetical protein
VPDVRGASHDPSDAEGLSMFVRRRHHVLAGAAILVVAVALLIGGPLAVATFVDSPQHASAKLTVPHTHSQ